MKTNRNEIRRTLLSVLLAMIFTVQMAGCGQTAGTKEKVKPWHPDPPKAVQTAPEAPVIKPAPAEQPEVTRPAPAPDASVPDEPVKTADPEFVQTLEPETKQPKVDNAVAEPDPASVQGVARLKDMIGCYALVVYDSPRDTYLNVNTEDEHNPYDLTWRYGPKVDRIEKFEDPDWDTLYRSYVDTCDWSLVFDAKYYKKAFPMLAKLYHDNDELLLEHFQTQGVHEGRQASAGFNVAAYMDRCGQVLTDAFGDDYECYYFYYMLNQDTQRGVDAGNPDSAYPRWLTLELSVAQSGEVKGVAKYREKADVQVLTVDPELVALANYRAWYDAEHTMYGHDWIFNDDTKPDMENCLRLLSSRKFAENTLKWYSVKQPLKQTGFAAHYADSKSHYDAMIANKYAYSGYSNVYWSDHPDNPFAENDATGYMTQFDIFMETTPKSPYDPN